jgi:hypothetical protein
MGDDGVRIPLLERVEGERVAGSDVAGDADLGVGRDDRAPAAGDAE